MEIFLLVVPLFALAAWFGNYKGMQDFYGGWGRRWTHKCGWFAHHKYDFVTREPCPRCGEEGRDGWHARMGRPAFPWGWEWKDEK